VGGPYGPGTVTIQGIGPTLSVHTSYVYLQHDLWLPYNGVISRTHTDQSTLSIIVLTDLGR